MAAPAVPQLGGTGLSVDLHEGSVLQVGVTSLFSSYAVRRGFIDGKNSFDWLGETSDPGSHNQLQKAILTALTPSLHGIGMAGEYVHPSASPTIPLHHIKAWKWGPNAYFELYYKNSRWSLPPVSAATSATYDTVYEHQPVYRRVDNELGVPVFPFVNGLPAGYPDIPDEVAGLGDAGNAPRSRVFKKAALRILVSTTLSVSPYLAGVAGATKAAVNKVNSDEVQFFGTDLPGSFLPGEVRYDGAKVKWLAPFKLRIIYQFTASIGGFWRQLSVYSGSPGTWQVQNEDVYEQTSFRNVFPVAI